MSFFFVDRIYEIEPFKKAYGVKNVTKSEGYFYPDGQGGRYLNPVVISEAAMQLISWLILHSTDYKLRPVALKAVRCEFPTLARIGDQIELEITMEDMIEERATVQAIGKVGDKIVLEAQDCLAYTLPAEEFDDPKITRKQFAAIYRPEFRNVSRVDTKITLALPTAPLDTEPRLIDRVLGFKDENEILTLKQFSLGEEFFKDHFPRMPVVPAILQLLCLHESAQALVSHFHPERLLIPRGFTDVRLRHFIHPGSSCEITVHLDTPDLHRKKNTDIIRAPGFIHCEGKKVMQAEYMFSIA